MSLSGTGPTFSCKMFVWFGRGWRCGILYLVRTWLFASTVSCLFVFRPLIHDLLQAHGNML